MSDLAFLRKLMEAVDNPSKIIGIYPGRFQVFHKGHASVYDFMKGHYPTTFIATSNKVEPPKSPFTFEEKKAMMELAGVPGDAIVQCRQPYVPVEILQNFDGEVDKVVFAVSQKDMEEDPRFQFKPKRDGSAPYFQPWKDDESMQPFGKHGYIRVAPTLDFDVLGEPMRSATQLRAQFAQADGETQKAIIEDLYGKYDEGIHKIMYMKLKGMR